MAKHFRPLISEVDVKYECRNNVPIDEKIYPRNAVFP